MEVRNELKFGKPTGWLIFSCDHHKISLSFDRDLWEVANYGGSKLIDAIMWFENQEKAINHIKKCFSECVECGENARNN